MKKREIVFFKLRKLRFFCTFSKKLEKNRSWSTTNQNILWEVLMSCEYFLQMFFFCRNSERYKKISWNNKKQHQKMLFFKSPIYSLLVCLFYLSLSHEVSCVQPWYLCGSSTICTSLMYLNYKHERFGYGPLSGDRFPLTFTNKKRKKHENVKKCKKT